MTLSNPLEFIILKLTVMLRAKTLGSVLATAHSALKPSLLSIFKRVAIRAKSAIVLDAISFGLVLTAADNASSMFNVKLLMLRIASKKHKIFNSVIVPNSIYMVNQLRTFKWASDVILHHQTMLKNISASDRLGNSSGPVVDKNVSAFILNPPSAPTIRAFRTLGVGLFAALKAHSLSIWCSLSVFANLLTACSARNSVVVFSNIHLWLKYKLFPLQSKTIYGC